MSLNEVFMKEQNRLMRNWILLGVMFLIFNSGTKVLWANDSVAGKRLKAQLETNVPNFRTTEVSAAELIKLINEVSAVPINAELVSIGSAKLTVGGQNMIFRQVLDECCKVLKADWSVRDDVINITGRGFPQKYFTVMNVKITGFEVSEETKAEAVDRLFQLPQFLEAKVYMTFARNRSLEATDSPLTAQMAAMTPREILNRIVEVDGKSYWMILHQEGYNFFSFGRRPTD
jgi:hypothetical protein